MSYELNWLGEAILLPAWGLALAGFVIGAAVMAMIWFFR